MNALRPFGQRDDHAPDHALRAMPYVVGGLRFIHNMTKNKWIGANVLRRSGAVRLLQLLQRSPPDLSATVLDVWLAHRVAEGTDYTGLRTYVWEHTNELFWHGDERTSERREFNFGLPHRKRNNSLLESAVRVALLRDQGTNSPRPHQDTNSPHSRQSTALAVAPPAVASAVSPSHQAS